MDRRCGSWTTGSENNKRYKREHVIAYHRNVKSCRDEVGNNDIQGSETDAITQVKVGRSYFVYVR